MPDRVISQRLGYAGLLPFYGLISGSLFCTDWEKSISTQGFIIYSLAILCFLAGALWGMAQKENEAIWSKLVVSNGLVLFAVGAVLTAQVAMASLLLMFAYMALWWFERRAFNSEVWYVSLRSRLTIGVTVAHIIFLAGQLSQA